MLTNIASYLTFIHEPTSMGTNPSNKTFNVKISKD